MHGFERRYSDRLPVPGAKIEYKRKDGNSSIVKLLDLTKSSICFETNDTIEIGEFIDLEIIVPNEEKINIKGTVIRNSNRNEKIKPYTVIKFLPFGSNGNYNSLQTLDQIKSLLEK